MLKTHLDDIKARNQYKKFAADLHSSERAKNIFFDLLNKIACNLLLLVSEAPMDRLPKALPRLSPVIVNFVVILFQSPSPDLYDRRTGTYQPLRLVEYLQATTAHLSPTQVLLMDAPLTANDFYYAILNSKNGKAPGPDGLPIEYYKVDIHDWARIFESDHDNQLHKGQMTKFQRRAHLSLLLKVW